MKLLIKQGIFIKFACLFLMPILVHAQVSPSDCSQFPSQPATKALLASLDELEESAPGISNYKVSNYPIVLFDSANYPGCKITRLKRHSLAVEASVTPNMQNTVYTFCGPYMPKCPVSLPVQASGRAIIYDMGQMSKNGKGFFPGSWEDLARLLNFYIISHEGFHYFIESRVFGLNLFPEYSNGLHFENRKVVSEKCYALTDEVSSLTKKELTTLFSALTAAQNNELDQQKKLMAEFVTIREERYKQTASVRINDAKVFGCRTAEARMEVDEGLADFAGLWALKQTGGWQTVNAVYEMFLKDFKRSDEHYYRLGSLQVLNLIASGIDPKIAFKGILSSKTPLEAVYGQTKVYFGDQGNLH